MPFELLTYSTLYPMAPLGGVFVALIGATLVLGGLWVRMRMRLLWISFPVATIAMVVSRHLTNGLPAPSRLQIGSLVLAVLLEATAFVIVMPRVRP